MDINTFKKIMNSIKDNFLANKKIIQEAINRDSENGYIVNFDNIVEEIRRSENDIIENSRSGIENQEIAVIYKGHPEVTIYNIIDSIFFNNKIHFCPEGYEILSTIIIELTNSILKEFKIEKKFIYIDNINNIILNQNSYDKIIYVGDYFEYENEQYNFDKELEYNSYGFLKVYIDKTKYKEEYKELTKYSYKKNISIEYYENISEFIENVNKGDTIIIYESLENIDKTLKNIRPKKVYTHDEFLNSYKFIKN